MKRNNPSYSRRDFIKKTTAFGVGVGVTKSIPVFAMPLADSFSSVNNKLEQNPLGYKGIQMDLVTRHYLLGNGNREYNPNLMRFHALDTMSPFGRGGINSYAYCMGDPVNRKDPSGHFFLLSLLIGAIIGAVIGAIIGAVAEGIRSAATGTPFDWKAVAIGAATGFISGGFGVAATGAMIGIKVGLALVSASIQASAVWGINVATGMSNEDAAKQAGITLLISLVTFGIGTGVKAGLKHTVVGRLISAKATSFGQSIRHGLRERLGFYSSLTNSKERLFNKELLQFRQTSPTKAHVFRAGGAKDLIEELQQPGVHKFVVSARGDFNIGTINGVHTKSLSHPVVARQFSTEVISAGYITKRFGRVIITNHSGHYKPSFESLTAAKDALQRLGVKPVLVEASHTNPAFIMLKATKAF